MSASESWLADLVRTQWREQNLAHFGGELVEPVLELARRRDVWAAWMPGQHRLVVSWQLLLDQPWGRVIEVLKHEMAHQYVEEVLAVRETPHGPVFRQVCAERGISAAAAGMPMDGEEPKAVRRLRKLLALAASPEAAEAKAAMAAAWRLIAAHGLPPDGEGDRYTVAWLGPVRGRRPRHEHVLAGVIAQHLGVEVTLVPAMDPHTGKRGRQVEVVGTPADVEVAAWTWEAVLAASERGWAASGRGGAKRQYLVGFVLGFAERFQQEVVRAEREEGLVKAGDPALSRWVGRRHARRRKGRRMELVVDADHVRGVADGRAVALRRPIHEREGQVRRIGADSSDSGRGQG